MLELCGRPNPDDIESLDSQISWNILGSINVTKRKGFHQYFPSASEDCIDLLKKLLAFNPKNRITIEEALAHPYVADFHVLEEEIVCKKAI